MFERHVNAHFLKHDVYQVFTLFLGGAFPGFAQVERVRAARFRAGSGTRSNKASFSFKPLTFCQYLYSSPSYSPRSKLSRIRRNMPRISFARHRDLPDGAGYRASGARSAPSSPEGGWARSPLQPGHRLISSCCPTAILGCVDRKLTPFGRTTLVTCWRGYPGQRLGTSGSTRRRLCHEQDWVHHIEPQGTSF